jgi:hypothetical protein
MPPELRKLPIGIQSFEKLILENTIYVDKTKYIYELIKNGFGNYFFSRPRRFGKSLLISTLEEIFSNSRELFKGLLIDSSDYQWKAYPVIKISFTAIESDSAHNLKQGLIKSLLETDLADTSEFFNLEIPIGLVDNKRNDLNLNIYPNPLEDDRIIRFKNLWIKKKGLSKPLFTKELSDGEHQFLHSLGLCLLFKNESCLFLLDEPETHFNPDWKAKFISSIRHCFALENTSTMREMLITTHSPYLVSDSESKYVHVFVKDNETKKVTCGFPEFQTLGTSVNKITLRIFNKPDTIGAFASSKIEELRKELEETKDKEVFLSKVRKEIGESVESMLFINDIIDQIENK